MKKLRNSCLAILLAVLLLTGLSVPARALEITLETGGISILKTDISGTGLSGARYRIYRQADPWELTDSSVQKELLKVSGEYKTMVSVSFRLSQDTSGVYVEELITDTTGKARAFGLPFGTYCLVETRAPAGYQRMIAPVEVKVNRYSHATEEDGIFDDGGRIVDNTVQIITIRYRLPEKLVNSSVMMVSGTAVVVSAAVLLLLNRTRREFVPGR